MKRFILFLSVVLLWAAGCSDSDADTGSGNGPDDPKTPQVTTAGVTEYDAVSALLGGSVSGTELTALSETGVEYAVYADDADWTKAQELTAEPAASWSLRAAGLTAGTRYAVRAFVGMDGTRYYGEVKSFTTAAPAAEAVTVAQLRARHEAGADVSGLCVRGYVTLAVPDDRTTESFPAGTLGIYDNTGEPGTALFLTLTGDGGAELHVGDYVEIPLAGAQRGVVNEMIPQYNKVVHSGVRVIDSGHAIDPVWVTPASLAAEAAGLVCCPIRVCRVYAEVPGTLFSASGNRFTDGETSFAVFAASGSEVGKLTQNRATGSLCGICSYDREAQVVPLRAADVEMFTGDDGITEGEPSIGILNTEYYEFPPEGGERVVSCKVTCRAGQRLFADVRNIDEARYAVEIEGDRVRISARPNTTGATADYTNCYLYLADSKQGSRKAVATLRLTQLCSRYESIPALIQANDGELSSVHEAVVNGFETNALKLGSGNYTGHFTSDPTGAVGKKRLVFYAVGWQEGDHGAGTLYLRVTGGGSASVASVPLKINTGATGQAPFVMTVADEDRYEVTLSELEPGSVIDFSTSPQFDKRKDDRTGRALLFGVQVCD